MLRIFHPYSPEISFSEVTTIFSLLRPGKCQCPLLWVLGSLMPRGTALLHLPPLLPLCGIFLCFHIDTFQGCPSVLLDLVPIPLDLFNCPHHVCTWLLNSTCCFLRAPWHMQPPEDISKCGPCQYAKPGTRLKLTPLSSFSHQL